MEIKVLYQQGHSIRAIAEMTGHSRNTVRRQLRAQESPRFQKPQRTSKLDPFKSYIQERTGQCRLSGVRLHEEVKAMGYDGSLDVVQRFVRESKPDKKARSRLTVRFHDVCFCVNSRTPFLAVESNTNKIEALLCDVFGNTGRLLAPEALASITEVPPFTQEELQAIDAYKKSAVEKFNHLRTRLKQLV